MNSILHAVHIFTLATWLSVTGFGSLGMAVSGHSASQRMECKPCDPYENLECIMLTEEFSANEPEASQSTDAGSAGEADGTETEVPLADQKTLPTPPSMPETPEVMPLPEIPVQRAPTAKTPDAPAHTAEQPRPDPEIIRKPRPSRRDKPVSAAGGSPLGTVESQGKTGQGGRNGESGLSDAKRLGGGRMPAPTYPAQARAKGQSGTVVVEFIVGADGDVISANAKCPSPWPLLNERAVSCVRRWKFPPGGVTKFIRPIVFKLN